MLITNLSLDKSNINPYISTTLLQKIEETLLKGEKIILYLNKRGEYASLICQDCQHIYKCPACDVSLSVHKNPEKLVCHICGYTQNINLKCEKCNGTNILKIGVGTQQIEECLKKYFLNEKLKVESEKLSIMKPKIFRFDLDNIKNKSDKQKALDDLYDADIIIGTKMITTGFDFKNIGLIGVILIEQELSIPNYNTEEKAYINIKQIIGRGERLGKTTVFIIQSFIPNNEIIKGFIENNYKDFFKKTLEERKLFNYPPFTEIAYLEYRDKNIQKARYFIENLKNKLDLLNKKDKLEIILNNNPRKKYNQYHYRIILKGPKLREFIKEIKYEIIRNSNLVLIFD